jgi:glycosyltransferase involved in cell wall biosynthesis
MTADRIRIGIVLGTDFKGREGGGSQPTMRIFLKFACQRPFDIFLLGMSTCEEEPVGKVSKRVIYGREYPFIPLFFHDIARYANRKPLVPVRIQTFMAYLFRRKLVDDLRLDVLYLNAPQSLPFFWFKQQPILYHMHNPQGAEIHYARYAIARTKAFGYLYNKVVQKILETADEFVVIDHESYELYTRRVPARRDRFHLLPTSIDNDEFRPISGFDRRETRRQFGLPAEGKVLLCVGRLAWKKGVDLVIRAFAQVTSQLSDTYLAIAGEGDERAKLQKLVQELSLTRKVFFLGYIPQLPSPDLPCLYNCSDALVFGSLHESLALVLAEALACGKPVISTPVGIAPQVIEEGVTGFLLRSREPEEMAARIVQVIRDGQYSSDACVAAAGNYAGASSQICDVIQSMYSRDHHILQAHSDSAFPSLTKSVDVTPK